MGRIVSLLSRLDKAVQRRFDSVCFFLMSRFGVRKSMIRYFISAVVIVSAGERLLRYALTSTTLSFGRILIEGWMVLVMLRLQRKHFVQDNQAEQRPGTVSLTDIEMKILVWVTQIMKLLCAAVISLSLVAMYFLSSLRNANVVSTMITNLGMLAHFYLIRTPMQPPPAREKSPHAALQPSPVQT